jgi:prolyl 4-hydroxylase
MPFSLFQLGCLLQLFIYSSQGGVVVEDSATAGGAEVLGSVSNRTNETCLLEDSSSYEKKVDDIEISESSYKVGASASCVPDELGSDMGESQTLLSGHTNEILDRIAKARVYMEMVAVDDKYDKVRGICKNSHALCARWAELGECEANSGYMTVNCAPVCESCEQLHVETRRLMDPGAPASRGSDELGSGMGESQRLDTEHTPEILDRIAKARVYMEMVAGDDKYDKVRGICKNSHASCALWAVLGDCETTAKYMTVNCAPVCESCEQLDAETRCPIDPDAIDALYPGDLDKMFEDITTNPDFQQYEPKVLSRPEYAPGDSSETADYQLGPWMVVFDNAMSGEEADRLVELGGIEGYKLSASAGKMKEDGTEMKNTNSGRTSTNTWCRNDCYDDPTARAVMNRIANITGTPEMNSEYLQLLRYEEGQFYQIHNDYIPYQLQRPQGSRILTFFLYLNDMEEKDGGGTHFPKLNLTITPKKGRAVLWPSVLNNDPNMKDARTDHGGMPVFSGVKYGANAWIHQRDFKTPDSKGCR